MTPEVDFEQETIVGMPVRELLEEAAFAAGLKCKLYRSGEGLKIEGWAGWWNPLTVDADAFHLFILLRMTVRSDQIERRCVAAWGDGDRCIGYWMDFDDDERAAMRFAIVRAAAVISENIRSAVRC